MKTNEEAWEFVLSHLPEEWVKSVHLTGSRYICNPPVLDTDLDIVVLVENMHSAAYQLHLSGWGPGGSNRNDSTFISMKQHGAFKGGRLETFNLILTESPVFYARFVAATFMCREYNITDKEKRIALFGAVVDGKDGSEDEVPF